MYARPMHMCILLYVIMTQLQSAMTAIHEYGIYETIPISFGMCKILENN